MESLANAIRMQNPLAKVFYPLDSVWMGTVKGQICSIIIFPIVSVQFPFLWTIYSSILIKLIRLRSNSTGL